MLEIQQANEESSKFDYEVDGVCLCMCVFVFAVGGALRAFTL